MTDTDALTEKIKRALWDALPDVSEEDYGSVEPWLDRDAAAVLPIIRAMQAEAWGEGFQDGRRYDGEGDDGPRYINPYDGRDADR